MLCPFGAKRLRQISLVLIASFLLAASLPAQQQVFYAIGAAQYIPRDPQNPWRNPYRDVRLYEVDAATLRVVRSVSVEKDTPGYGSGKLWMTTGMLTGKRDTIVLSDGELRSSTLMRLAAPDLVVQGQTEIGDVRASECLDHIFVHPITGLAYFSCDLGSHGNGFVVLNTDKQAVVADLPDGPVLPRRWPRLFLYRPQFVYSSKDQKLYLCGQNVVVLDPQNRAIDYILARDVAQAAGFDVDLKRSFSIAYDIDKMAMLPDGNLVLLMNAHKTPTLVIYDPMGRKALRRWSETEKCGEMWTSIDGRSEKPVQKTCQFHHGPVPTRDGSRVFAMSDVDVVVWDSSTLEEPNRLEAPEPPDSGEECFFPAPDGRGMWFVGQSGNVYRLDDHTGKLIERVKLPFSVINLVREP
jgi:hypothetical protein